jgi:hypothetical protein
MLQRQIHSEDILHRAIYTVYEDVVEVLKEEFTIYSDYIFQLALQAASHKIDVQVVDESDFKKDNGNPMHKYVKVKLDLKIDGVKSVVLNTDTFEQKV